jgi:hypothetical protein
LETAEIDWLEQTCDDAKQFLQRISARVKEEITQGRALDSNAVGDLIVDLFVIKGKVGLIERSLVRELEKLKQKEEV